MTHKIWFIWQGFIGWNMADDFEERWFEIVRYSLDEKYKWNLEQLKTCDIVFVAVPTPTKNRKFDSSILDEAIKNTTPWQKIVIKSTIIPWTTDRLQEQYKDRYFFHSAEFLMEKSAKQNVSSPSRNIVGYTEQSKPYAQELMNILPKSIEIICTAKESELWKYFCNFLLTSKVLMANLVYDICQRDWINYKVIKYIAETDTRIWPSHLNISDDWWRWAWWHCFPKDVATLREYYAYKSYVWDNLFWALEEYNIKLLTNSWKNLEITKEVYGIKN